MEKITNEILNKLCKDWNDIAKKKHGKSREITYGDFIYAVIKFNSAKETIEYLNIRGQTFNRTIKRCFPDVKLAGGGQTWSHYLLNLANYKRCFKCNSIKCLDDFYKNIKHCKKCHSIKNKMYYASRKDIWDTYYDNNKSDYLARNAARRAIVKQQTPAWADLSAIKEIYKNCPIGYHVDHIIPLKGKNICGLHVQNNLQYLLAENNLKKSNKYE